MATTQEDVARLVSRLPLGKGHEGQERAVAAALDALLVRGHRGVVLADEVGFGKTVRSIGRVDSAPRARQAKRKTDRTRPHSLQAVAGQEMERGDQHGAC